MTKNVSNEIVMIFPKWLVVVSDHYEVYFLLPGYGCIWNIPRITSTSKICFQVGFYLISQKFTYLLVGNYKEHDLSQIKSLYHLTSANIFFTEHSVYTECLIIAVPTLVRAQNEINEEVLHFAIFAIIKKIINWLCDLKIRVRYMHWGSKRNGNTLNITIT